MKGVALVEAKLEQVARVVIRYPRRALAISLFCVVVLALGMQGLYVDVTNESMFHRDDPTLTQFKQFQAQFGRDDAVLAVIESPDIFSMDFFHKLDAYHQQLQRDLPYLDRVTSLINVTSVSTAASGDILIDDLRLFWPKEAADFPAFKHRIINSPLYRNLLIDEEGYRTAMVIRPSVFAVDEEMNKQVDAMTFAEKIAHWHDQLVAKLGKDVPNTSAGDDDFFGDVDNLDTRVEEESQPLTTAQVQQFIHVLKSITTEHHSDDFSIKLAGSPIITDEHVQAIHMDFAKLLPLTFLLVFILLFVMLRRLAAALIPLAVVLLTLLATLGLMGWAGLPITPVAVSLPPLLLTIGVADSVHILNSFYQQHHKSNHRDSAIIYAIRRTGLAVLFTSLTTIAGFMAFVVADIKPVADFGLLVGFGVALSFLLSIILIPAILVLLNIRTAKAAPAVQALFVHFMLTVTRFSVRNANKVLLSVLVIILVAIPGVTQLFFSHNTLEWFPEEAPVRVDTLWVDKVFKGIIPLEIVVDTGEKNGLYNPVLMQKLEAFQQYAENLNPDAAVMGRSTSIVDTLKRIHWVLHQENPSTAMPSSKELVAQELLLFESSGADDVAELIDSDFSLARVTVRISWLDAVDYTLVRQQLLKEAQKIFEGTADVWATGTVDLISRTLVDLMYSMTSSYLIALVMIAFMLVLLMRSLSLGLISLIPNFLPILVSLAIMGYLGLPINMFTVLLGGIALGLAVDDTMHFMHSYRYHRQQQKLSLEESIQQTVIQVGPALFFTTMAITLGFLVFLFSELLVVINFGLILGLTIVNALLFDLLVVPAIIKLVDDKGWFSVKAVVKVS